MPETRSRAICRALAAASGPALVFDLGDAVLLDTNPAAAGIWTGGGRMAALPMPLDVAMPALAALRLALDVDGAGAWGDLRLTFWTVAGVQCWDAQMQPIEGVPAGIVLVRLLADRAISARPLAGPSQSGRELRHLVHELRTPLAAIQSLADVLQGGHLGAIADVRHRDYLASMRDTARHALDVIEAMLQPSSGLRQAAPRAVGFDLDAAVAEVAAGMSALATRSGARLSAVAGAAVPLIAADGTAVRQMLINLVANSLTHAGGGVTVTIATGVGTEGRVWAEVTDNGPGLPLAVIERLAAGLPPAASPAGIERPQFGLSLTRSLAEANGGHLEVFSSRDGARVRLVFAAYQPPGGDQVVASSSG